MKKMNNKAFAVSTVVYSILILLTMFMFTMLLMYRNMYRNQKDFTTDLKQELNEYLVDKYTPPDTNKPTCTLEAVNKDVLTKTLVIKSTDPDLANEPYSFDGTTYSGINKKDITTDGTYTAYVKDLSGNVGNCSVNVVFDSDGPSISISVTGGKGTAKINATLTDSGTGVRYYAVTNSTATPTSWTDIGTPKASYPIPQFSKTSAGTYYIHAKDAVGNTHYEPFVLSLSRNNSCSCEEWNQVWVPETCRDSSTCRQYDSCAACGCSSYGSYTATRSYCTAGGSSSGPSCNAYGCYKTSCKASSSSTCSSYGNEASYCTDYTAYCQAYKSCSSCDCLDYEQICTGGYYTDGSTCETRARCWLS